MTCILAMLPAASTEAKQTPPYPRSELLIEATDLARPEIANRFRILDVRPRDAYLAGHVPGAAWVDHEDWSKAFAADQNQVAWTKRIERLGVSPATAVVIYDDNSSKDGARIWWILRYWGVQKARLLNGGWHAWNASAGPVTKKEGEYAAVNVKLAPEPRRLATKEQLLESLKGPHLQIVDARSLGEFCGATETAKRNGAIPGAIHLEWTEVIDPRSKRFKTAEQLAKLFHDAGIDLNQVAVTHCQSGGRAAVMAFALELMGAKEVRNYYRSWAEWGNASDTPIDKPHPKDTRGQGIN